MALKPMSERSVVDRHLCYKLLSLACLLMRIMTCFQCYTGYLTGIFLGLICGRISAPSQIKNCAKLPKIVYIIPNFLVLHFGKNFMNIRTKIAKLQMHENLDKNVNEIFWKNGYFRNREPPIYKKTTD